MSSSRKIIPPNPPRWKPNPDPASIVIPGLDTDASTTDQIEQIEQLITIKLQNIDENFSKIHNVLASKLLPAVKRYAVGTEPVREAAKFWTSFYEQAAQIRIPTVDDYSTVNETPSEHEEANSSAQAPEHIDDTANDQTTRPTQDVYETSVVNSETSFLPGQGAFSSTPATARLATTSFTSQGSEDPSWTQSMESPLVRLNREINNFSRESSDSLVPSTSSAQTPAQHDYSQDDDSSNFTFQQDTSVIPRPDKGKGKDTSHPLLKNVLRHNLYSASDNSSFENKVVKVSPLKLRSKPKTPTINKSLNPYLTSDAPPANWNGVVDLRDPSVLTPQRHRSRKSPAKNPMTPYADDDDDSFDGLPPGMSPPVLMSPARPPRSSAELGLLKLGQTPARDASARIQRDLVRDAQLKSGGDRLKTFPKHGYESSLSSVPSPPSLSRYNRHNYSSSSSNFTKDSSLESMIQRIRVGIRPSVGMTPGMGSTPGLRIRPRTAAQEPEPEVTPSPTQQPYFAHPAEPATPVYGQQQDMDSDSDSLDEINNTAHPSAAFLMASQGGAQYDDDSFGSSDHSSDSLNDEDVGGADIVPVHPFANVVEDDGFDDDDSFDGFDNGGGGAYTEETVFGAAPAERQRAYGSRQSDGENLRMLGEALLQDTIGIGSHIAATGRVEESPTPASWAH
ncbi:hypothetical protein GALMADRAFT_84362 [Galerina marginata CBS 339.88]|uniref:DASH complex subunit ASK1 n=1 Tax=Galerina marginata (strain CBS 339.88) TaxID=685588 RepID=A0A067TT76_GALM3|nr:hypothetical protein GALMADRAFT_84362 [Galerina marginata CBS 339.88]